MKRQLHVRCFIDFKVRNTFIVPTDSEFQQTTSTGNNYLQAYRIQFMWPLKGHRESPKKEIKTEVVCANYVIQDQFEHKKEWKYRPEMIDRKHK